MTSIYVLSFMKVNIGNLFMFFLSRRWTLDIDFTCLSQKWMLEIYFRVFLSQKWALSARYWFYMFHPVMFSQEWVLDIYFIFFLSQKWILDIVALKKIVAFIWLWILGIKSRIFLGHGLHFFVINIIKFNELNLLCSVIINSYV